MTCRVLHAWSLCVCGCVCIATRWGHVFSGSQDRRRRSDVVSSLDRPQHCEAVCMKKPSTSADQNGPHSPPTVCDTQAPAAAASAGMISIQPPLPSSRAQSQPAVSAFGSEITTAIPQKPPPPAVRFYARPVGAQRAATIAGCSEAAGRTAAVYGSPLRGLSSPGIHGIPDYGNDSLYISDHMRLHGPGDMGHLPGVCMPCCQYCAFPCHACEVMRTCNCLVACIVVCT
jgi:hypothetical protein